MELYLELERLRRSNAQLQRTVSQLEQRVQELGVESEDLREICAAKGVDVTDALAARQHRRMFARALTDHPPSTASIASEALNMLEISTRGSLLLAESTAIASQRHGMCWQSRHASPNLGKVLILQPLSDPVCGKICGNSRGRHSKQ